MSQDATAHIAAIIDVCDSIDRHALLCQAPTPQQLRLWVIELEDAIDIPDDYLQRRREERQQAKARIDSITVTLEVLDKFKRTRRDR